MYVCIYIYTGLLLYQDMRVCVVHVYSASEADGKSSSLWSPHAQRFLQVGSIWLWATKLWTIHMCIYVHMYNIIDKCMYLYIYIHTHIHTHTYIYIVGNLWKSMSVYKTDMDTPWTNAGLSGNIICKWAIVYVKCQITWDLATKRQGSMEFSWVSWINGLRWRGDLLDPNMCT